MEYAFTHAITFGNFSNNLKKIVGAQEQEEPNTVTEENTVVTPLPDGTVTRTTTSVATTTSENDGILTIKVVTKIISINTSGNSVTTLDKVVFQTTVDDKQTIIYRTSDKIVTEVNPQSDGSKTTIITTTVLDEEGEETITIIATNTLITEVLNTNGSITTTTVVKGLNPSTLDTISLMTLIETVLITQIDQYTTIEDREIDETRTDNTRTFSNIITKTVKDPENNTTTVTVTTRSEEFDANGNTMGITTDEVETVFATESLVGYNPNARHFRVKMGTLKEMQAAMNSSSGSPFLSGEILYCYDIASSPVRF